MEGRKLEMDNNEEMKRKRRTEGMEGREDGKTKEKEGRKRINAHRHLTH
jgi:hypothetical protein